jgi:hypothetical protein
MGILPNHAINWSFFGATVVADLTHDLCIKCCGTQLAAILPSLVLRVLPCTLCTLLVPCSPYTYRERKGIHQGARQVCPQLLRSQVRKEVKHL